MLVPAFGLANSFVSNLVMLRTFRSSPWLWLVWGALLLAFIFVPGTGNSVSFWALAVAAVAATGAQMINTYRRAEWERETVDGIEVRLEALGATLDLDEDVDALLLLDVEGWEDVFRALESMPAGERSVRRAIEQVNPEALS
jgi:hypothetical protein